MYARFLKYPSSKWAKHRVLMENEQLHPILPAATVYHQTALKDYFLEFPIVYIKPLHGSGGNKILKLTKTEERISVQTNNRIVHYSNFKRATAHIRRHIKKSKYLLQQGINILQVEEAPVDFRILLLKRRRNWKWYGMIGRKGKVGSAVTNRAQGGKAITFSEALSQGLGWNEEQIEEMRASVQHYSQIIAHTLNQYFPNINQLGLDMAIDAEGRLFLIEANTRPHYRLFRQHEDRALYAKVSRTIRILRYPPATRRKNSSSNPHKKIKPPRTKPYLHSKSVKPQLRKRR